MAVFSPSARFLCGTYSVHFHQRPGSAVGAFTAKLPRSETTGQWGRRANATATAELTVDTCAFPRVEDLKPWAHYATFSRSGYSAPVMVGPIVGIAENDTGTNTATITVADPSAWWWEAGLQAYAASGALSSSTGAADYITGGPLDSGQVFNDLVRMSEQVNPTGLGIRVDATGETMEARYMRSDGQTIGMYIDLVTAHSVDWTVVGNQLRAGGYRDLINGGSIPASAWSEPPSLLTSGYDLATRVEMVGETTASATSTAAIEALYGVHELFIPDHEVADEKSAIRRVTAALERLKVPPEDLSASTASLNQSTPFGFAELICGTAFTVDAGSRLRPGSTVRRLNELAVFFEEGGETAVRPTFEPVGAAA